MSNYQKPKYKTTNWPAYNNKALKRRGSLTIWLDPTLNWYAPLSGKRGRSATYTDQAIECCLTIKALFQLPLALLHKSNVDHSFPIPANLRDTYRVRSA